MPTIVFACPKGGVGKTTSALLLAIQLAKFYPVTVIDADPNNPITRWATGDTEPKTLGANVPKSLAVVWGADEDNIIDLIEDAASKTAFVVVDLEGTASKIVLMAISQADFVIIPTQGSELDANEASRAIRVVRQHDKMTKTAMPFAVLLTRTNSQIRARNLTHIQRSLIDAGIPVLETELNEREAFKSIFVFRETLDGLNPKDVANLDKAKQNVEEFAAEIIGRLSKRLAA